MATVVTGLSALLSFVRRVEVHGDSMLPTLRPGERLLVVKARRSRPGQLVVVRDPRATSRVLVKRVTAVDGDKAHVTGDNAAATTDSAMFGPVPVVARVVYRYHPSDRAGMLS